MTQLATIREAGNYLSVLHQKQFSMVFGDDDKKASAFLGVALANIQREPKLLLCNRESVRDALLEAAQIDLCPGGALGQAFLIPYGRDCQFQIGYKGLAEIVQREGAVKKVWGNVVYEDEVEDGRFKVSAGSNHYLIHDRDPFREDPPSWEELVDAGLVGAYACAELHNGAVNFEVVGVDVLTRAKAMSNSPAWKKWATEMAKKFPLKRLCKRLPKTLAIEQWAAIDEKHGLRDAVPLKSGGSTRPGGQVQGGAMGDTTVDVPLNPRVETNRRIKEAWMELRGEDDKIAALEMDREFEDYLLDERTSDAEAHHFLDKMLGVLS